MSKILSKPVTSMISLTFSLIFFMLKFSFPTALNIISITRRPAEATYSVPSQSTEIFVRLLLSAIFSVKGEESGSVDGIEPA